MEIIYFIGDVPERGFGVALRFPYDPGAIADLKQALAVARDTHWRRHKTLPDDVGGWTPRPRVWFCPIQWWTPTARRMQAAGHVLTAVFDEVFFYVWPLEARTDDREPHLPSPLAADWERFGLPPGSSAADLKRAYRDLIEVWHPDRFTHNPRLQAKAEARTKELTAAYQRLQDAA